MKKRNKKPINTINDFVARLDELPGISEVIDLGWKPDGRWFQAVFQNPEQGQGLIIRAHYCLIDKKKLPACPFIPRKN